MFASIKRMISPGSAKGDEGQVLSSWAKAEGYAFDDSMPAVFERFTVVWPPGDADPEGA